MSMGRITLRVLVNYLEYLCSRRIRFAASRLRWSTPTECVSSFRIPGNRYCVYCVGIFGFVTAFTVKKFLDSRLLLLRVFVSFYSGVLVTRGAVRDGVAKTFCKVGTRARLVAS
jgi:hypothetical protein